MSRWREANEMAVAFVSDRTNVALRAEVITTFQPLVRSIAHKIPFSLLAKMGVTRDDAISEANIAFMHALDRFRPDKATLCTFAHKTIEGELKHWIRNTTHSRIHPQPYVVSMDAQPSSAWKEEVGEALARRDERKVEDMALEHHLAREVIDAGRRVLDPRDFYILESLARGESQRQIGTSLGISQGHVSRIYLRLIEALRVEMGA